MKILITGGSGFIGRHLVECWKSGNHSITVLARHIDASLFSENISCIAADITVKESVQAAIISAKPDVVIHTAALSKPNDCEANKSLCFATNVAATGYISAACKTVGAKLVFLSTDFVFSNNGPYSEMAPCEPVNYYGESKRQAEEVILSSGVAHAIIRTGLVIGPILKGQANTFLHWVRDNLAAGKEIQLYTDQQRSPTLVTDLCKGIDAIIRKDFTGTIHLSGSEAFSPYSLAQQVAVFFGLNAQLLHPVTSAERPEAARRPPNAVLNIDKAKQQLGYETTPLKKALENIFG